MSTAERGRAGRWLIPVLLIASFLGGFWVGAWSISQDIRRRARHDIEVALQLSAPNVSMDQLRQRLRIPAGLREKDEATLYYLLAAREVEEGKETGANYFLALHFLTRDCSLAQHYLNEQLRVGGADQRVSDLLKSIKAKGCTATAEAMRKGA